MYYRLDIDVSTKGNFGVRDRIPGNYDVFAKNTQGDLSKYEFPKVPIKFSGLILTDDSIEADFIADFGAIGGWGLIVSTRVKEILLNFELGTHRFYDLDFINKDGKIEKNKYHYLQILVGDSFSWIDYEKSIFYFVDFEELLSVPNPKREYVKFNSENEFRTFIEKFDVVNYKLKYEKIVLNSSFCKQPLDLFKIEKVDFDFFISEKLKNVLSGIKVTGLLPFDKKSIYCPAPSWVSDPDDT